MKLKLLTTGELLNAGDMSVYSYPIATGIPQNVVFTEMTNVTSVTVTMLRNGTPVGPHPLILSEGMTFNLSAMALAFPPLNVLAHSSNTIDVSDVIRIASVEAGISKLTYINVVSLASENIGGQIGSKYGKNLYTGGVDSRTGFYIRDGVATTVPIDGLLGTMYTYRGEGSTWHNIVATATYSVAIYLRVVWTVKIHNTSEIPISANLLNGEGNVTLSLYEVPPKTKVSIRQTFDTKGHSNVRMYIMVGQEDINRDAQCIVSEFGLYPNCAPPQWTPSSTTDGSTYVGYLTDYRDGWKRKPFDNVFATQDGAGTVSSERILFKTHHKTYRAYPEGAVDIGTIYSGYRWFSQQFNYSYYNADGSLYGCQRWKDDEIKQPPSCRVQLRWLNTKGAFDFMLFDTYKVTPVLNQYDTGGSSVDYYEVTVQREFDGNNDDALRQLTRSAEVYAVIPENVNVWGEAKVIGNSVYSKAAGSTTQIMTVKLKVTL